MSQKPKILPPAVAQSSGLWSNLFEGCTVLSRIYVRKIIDSACPLQVCRKIECFSPMGRGAKGPEYARACSPESKSVGWESLGSLLQARKVRSQHPTVAKEHATMTEHQRPGTSSATFYRRSAPLLSSRRAADVPNRSQLPCYRHLQSNSLSKTNSCVEF